MEIKENLRQIKEQIDNINVKIIAVTKYASQEQVFEAYKLGIRNFGESYLQDALERISKKYSEDQSDNINWHFIGRLQKNKVKHVVRKFCLIHSVDSLELAELINKYAKSQSFIQDILLQVNVLKEQTKAGFSVQEIRETFGKLIDFPNVNIKGLMTIAPKTDDKDLVRECFTTLSNLKTELNHSSMSELSMGMSNDYLIAIECGATMIRIGRKLFN